MDSKMLQFLEGLPKVELHVHLEGAIPVETLWELIKKYNGDKELGSIEKVREKFQYRDFHHFLETWIWKDQFIRQYEDCTFFADSVAYDLKQQNVKYAEMHFTPGGFLNRNLKPNLVIEAIKKGLKNHSSDISIYLIADLCRNFEAETVESILDELIEMKEACILGVGLGGDEKNYPPHRFRKYFEKAKNHGLRTTAHAGEAAGAESVWGAIKELKVDRIGHGTRACEDAKLLHYLKETQLPVEMCPLSNLRTKVVETITAHPIKQFFDLGLNISVNTDDPKMFNNNLAEEYLTLIDELNFTLSDIRKILIDTIQASWCDNEMKVVLSKQVNAYCEANPLTSVSASNQEYEV